MKDLPDKLPAPAGPEPNGPRLRLRLLLPLVLGFGALLGVFTLSVRQNQQGNSARDAEVSARIVQRMLRVEQEQAIATMLTAGEAIMARSPVAEAFRQRDHAALLQHAAPWLELLRQRHGISHIEFTTPDRMVLLRLHRPELRGDIINRPTSLEAEKTGRVAAGLERGFGGTFTVRVVAPWRQDGQLLGYLEMGIEFEEILQSVHRKLNEGVDFVIAVDKKLLDRARWEKDPYGGGLYGSWDRFPDKILSSRTVASISQPVLDYLAAVHPKVSGLISWKDHRYQLASLPLADEHGTTLGELIIQQDATAEVGQTRDSIRSIAVMGLGVGALLFGLFYLLLARVERNLTERTAKLRDESAGRQRALDKLAASDEFLRSLLENIPVNIFRKDLEGRFVFVNDRFCRVKGRTREQLLGQTSATISAPDVSEKAGTDHATIIRTGLPIEREEAYPQPDGTTQYLHVLKTPIRDAAGKITGTQGLQFDITSRKLAEQALHKSERQFRTIIDSAYDAFVATDAAGLVTGWNDQATSLFGWSRTEAVGQVLATLIVPPQHRTAHEQGMKLFLATSEGPVLNRIIEITACNRAGREFPVELTIRPLREGNTLMFSAFLRDISERKRAEATQAALLKVAEAAHEAQDLTLLYQRIHEIVSELLSARNFYVAVHDPGADLLSFPYFVDEVDPVPAPRPPGNGLTARVLRTGQSLLLTAAQIEALHRAGEISLVGTPPLDWLGVPLITRKRTIGVLAVQNYSGPGRYTEKDRELLHYVSRQIAEAIERKQAETRIRQLSQAVEQSPATVVITDLAGNIEYTNPRFSEVTGYSAEEARGRNPRILKSGETSPAEYERLWRIITTGGTWRGEFHNRRKDGGLYWEEASISPICDARGQTTHYLAVKTEITARKQAERELVAAKEAAEAAARAKSEFLANMSHEIRTPMNGVIGMTGLLLDTKLDPEQRQFAETVRSSADNLMVVINDILDFSKIEAGKLTFEELDFDLVETIEGALDMLAERAQAKGIELIDAIAPAVPSRLRGDPGRLRQILTNLLGNALKFTERGEVVLRVGVEQETDTHAVIRFSVTDTGIGIPRQVQEKLFQSFSQADSSTTRKYGGTGLGLAISKQLVGLMHGEIGVESEAGRGATFWFTARLEKQTGAPKPRREASPSLFNLRVLVVDDNATNRQILRHQIFAWKMQKGSAAGGHEALKLLREAAAAGQPYAIALLDMQMPEMDGLSLARAIKADPAIAAIHLIMLTSLGHRFTRRELLAAGIDAYLVKPVKQSRLYDTLVDVIGDAEAQRALVETPSTPPPTLSPATKSFRVLVAEDNQVNQKIAVAQLRKLGCAVDVVANGREVLECLPRLKYDLIFMDCQMPEMDGYEASQAIRKREAEQTCPWKGPVRIVAMTANAMQGDREKCLAAGMDDYVSKPVRLADLQAALLRAQA